MKEKNNQPLLEHYRIRKEPIKYIIIHCSRSEPKKMIQIMEENGVSAHYVISKKGELISVIPEQDVAYHSGMSNWHNSPAQSLNETSIGIELECPSMGQSQRSYNHKTIETLCRLLSKLQKKYKISPEHILAHSDIAPERKPDPGAWFPWKKLYQKGLIYWYDERSLAKETDERILLNNIGYTTTDLSAARYAFCRRWLKEEVLFDKVMQHLLDNPYPKNFKPKDKKRYIKRLRAVANAVEKIRKK